MKRILHVLLFAVLILCLLFTVACESECTEHTDTDKNHKCDYCEADYTAECTEHTDDDGNTKCDYCDTEAFISNATLWVGDKNITEGNYVWLDKNTGKFKFPLVAVMSEFGCSVNLGENSNWISYNYQIEDIDKLVEEGYAVPHNGDFIVPDYILNDFVLKTDIIYTSDTVNSVVRIYRQFRTTEYTLESEGKNLNYRYFFDLDYEDTGVTALPITAVARSLGATVRIDGTKYTMEYEGKTLVLDSSLEDFGLPHAREEGGIRTVINGELIVDLESARYPLFEFMNGMITISHGSEEVFFYTLDGELIDVYNANGIEGIYVLNLDGKEVLGIPLKVVLRDLGLEITNHFISEIIVEKGKEAYTLHFCETEEEFVEEENYFCILQKDAIPFLLDYIVDFNLLTELFDSLGITVTRDEENKFITFSITE